METCERNQIRNDLKGPIVTANDLDGADTVARSLLARFPTATRKHLIDVSTNCHGLTFGARRAVIFRPEDVELILKDDRYSEIDVKESLSGDVIIYYLNGVVDHSGIVMRPGDTLSNPWILSKWGLPGPEMIHRAQDSEYGVDYKVFRKQPLC